MYKKGIAFIQRIFGLIIFAYSLIIFLCPTSYSKDLVNIDLVGTWGNRGDINCVKVCQGNNHNRYAYCGSENGLLIIDVTDPISPKEITFLEIGDIYDIAFYHSDNEAFSYVVLAAGGKGIIILDISDPKRPTYASQFDTKGGALGVAISNNYAFVANGYNGLVIIDCSDPSGPFFVADFDIQGYT